MPDPDCTSTPSTKRIPLHVLLVEDSEVDAELLVAELQRGGYQPAWERVDTATALNAALEGQPWDVITCDWVMPQFSGPAALALLQLRQVDVPIIVVSGQVGEEYAVTAMKAGAHDFVSKEKLARLCPAIERELKEAQIRREHKQARKALAAAHEKLRVITDNMLDMLSFVTVDGVFQYVSPSHQRTLGYAPEDLLGRSAFELFHPEDVAPVTSAFQAGIKDRTPGRVAFRYRHADGHYVWLEAVGSPFFDNHGSVVGVVVNGRDITERKCAEEALRESNERVGSILNSISDAFFSMDDQLVVSYFNGAAERLLHRRQEEVLGRNLFEAFPEAKGSIFETNYRQAVRDKQPLTFETYFDREPYRDWYDVRVFPQREGISVYFQVITERKQAEDALRMAKDFAENLIETANGAIVVLDTEGTIRIFNRAAEEMTGYTRAEVIDRNLFNVLVPRDRYPTVSDKFKDLLADGVPRNFENPILTKSGEERLFCWRNSEVRAHGRVVGTLSFGTDITDRKRAEVALRESEERLRGAQLAALVISWDWDVLSGKIVWSGPVAEQLGFPPGGFDGTYEGFFGLVHPEDREFVRQAVARALLDGGKYDAEFRFVRPDGVVRWVAARGHVVRDKSGQAVRLLGLAQDITKRKRGEAELRQSEQHFRSLIEHSSDLVVVLASDGTIRYASPSEVQAFGYTLEEFVGRNVSEFIHREDLPRVGQLWRQGVEKRLTRVSADFRLRRKDGSWRVVESIGINLLDDPAVAGILVQSNDITECGRVREALH